MMDYPVYIITYLRKRAGHLSFSEILFIIVKYGLATILLIAGVAKLINNSDLITTLRRLRFLSSSLVIWIA